MSSYQDSIVCYMWKINDSSECKVAVPQVSVVHILFNVYTKLPILSPLSNLSKLNIKEGSKVASRLNLNMNLSLPFLKLVFFSYVQNSKCVSES